MQQYMTSDQARRKFIRRFTDSVKRVTERVDLGTRYTGGTGAPESGTIEFERSEFDNGLTMGNVLHAEPFGQRLDLGKVWSGQVTALNATNDALARRDARAAGGLLQGIIGGTRDAMKRAGSTSDAGKILAGQLTAFTAARDALERGDFGGAQNLIVPVAKAVADMVLENETPDDERASDLGEVIAAAHGNKTSDAAKSARDPRLTRWGAPPPRPADLNRATSAFHDEMRRSGSEDLARDAAAKVLDSQLPGGVAPTPTEMNRRNAEFWARR